MHPGSISLMADVIDFSLDRQLVQTRKGQAQEQADSSFELEVGIAKGMFDLLWRTFQCGGIGNAPMRRHGLPRPDGTRFLRRIVANGEDKIHLWGSRLCELFPALAAQAPSRQVRHFDQFQRFRPHDSRRVTSRTVTCEKGLPLPLRIASAIIERAEFPVHRNRTL